MSEQQCCEAVHTAIGEPVPVQVRGANPWRPTVQMADEFRAGRAFLVGDAARTVPPLGAFGLNTGMADAHNLAWKLALVLDGQAGDGLLDTYHAERHAIAELVTRQALLRWENPRLHFDPAALQERAAVGAWNAPLVTMGNRYDSTAVIDPVVQLPSTEDLAASLDGAPGSRVPHRWVTPDVPMQDLNESRFAVLTGPDGADWHAATERVAAAQQFDLRAITLGRASAAALRMETHGAILVRPDGYIAWRTDASGDATVLEAVIRTVTSRSR